MAHPDKLTPEKLEKLRKCAPAYETLFHRVFLKILGYQRRYVDRSVWRSTGFPEKLIDTPLGIIPAKLSRRAK